MDVSFARPPSASVCFWTIWSAVNSAVCAAAGRQQTIAATAARSICFDGATGLEPVQDGKDPPAAGHLQAVIEAWIKALSAACLEVNALLGNCGELLVGVRL